MNYTIELTYGIGPRLRVCEQTVCVLVYLKEYSHCGLQLLDENLMLCIYALSVFLFGILVTQCVTHAGGRTFRSLVTTNKAFASDKIQRELKVH